MDKVIYTIGYGNDKPEDFLNRLSEAHIELVIDVRREGSRARLGCYVPSIYSVKGIAALLATRNIGYSWAMELGNSFKVTATRSKEDCLLLYEALLLVKLREKEMENLFFTIIWTIKNYNQRTAFLCAEKKVMKNGSQNCHRGIVAERIVKRLEILDGYEWSIEHL